MVSTQSIDLLDIFVCSFLDYLKEDRQLEEYIDENEKIIEKYHQKMNEIIHLMKEHSDEQKEIQWSPIAMDYKKMEEEEKRLCLEKKKNYVDSQINTDQNTSDDKGVYL
jgi:hypothetical protein